MTFFINIYIFFASMPLCLYAYVRLLLCLCMCGQFNQCNLCRDCTSVSSLQERLLRYVFYRSCLPHKSSQPLLTTDLRDIHISRALGVFLCRNYRSHRSILAVPSRLFYEDTLVECAHKSVINSLCKWEMLPQEEEFPLLCIGVDGSHHHSLDSPSYFNLEEVIYMLIIYTLAYRHAYLDTMPDQWKHSVTHLAYRQSHQQSNRNYLLFAFLYMTMHYQYSMLLPYINYTIQCCTHYDHILTPPSSWYYSHSYLDEI